MTTSLITLDCNDFSWWSPETIVHRILPGKRRLLFLWCDQPVELWWGDLRCFPLPSGLRTTFHCFQTEEALGWANVSASTVRKVDQEYCERTATHRQPNGRELCGVSLGRKTTRWGWARETVRTSDAGARRPIARGRETGAQNGPYEGALQC